MSVDERTNKPYNMQFPAVTIRDMVHVQEKLVKHLNIQKLAAVIGPSFGGMLAIEWGVMYPNLVEKCISLGASFSQSQWGIAWNEISRLTIMNSEDWNGGNYVTQPQKSLSLSRYPFIVSCGNHEKINLRTKNLEVIPDQIITNFFPIQKVLTYYCETFKHDANSFLFLLNATNTHDIRRNRPNLIKNMEISSVQFIVIGVTSDYLYFSDDLKKEVDTFPHCTYYELSSDVGHDAVIIEQEKISAILQEII